MNKTKIDRTGERHLTNEGYWITIIEYFSSRKSTIEFGDGFIMRNIQYGHIKAGRIRKPIDRVGETYINTDGNRFEITEFLNAKNCTIKFEDGTILKNIQYGHILRGNVKNPFHKSVMGEGYIGIGKYKSSGYIHKRWNLMLTRAYGTIYHSRFPTYKDVEVCEEWKCLQNFGAWYEENFKSHMDNSWELDKDIKVAGNKIYSPETCAFVPSELNSFFVKRARSKKGLPLGVSKRGNKYYARSTAEGENIQKTGFTTIEEAFQVVKCIKEKEASRLANKYKEKVDQGVYTRLSNFKLYIND